MLAEKLDASPMENEIEERVYIRGDVRLECNHILHFDIATPHKKEMLWCRRCRKEFLVVETYTGEAFRVKCETCNFTRGKAGELAADRAAVNHRYKRGFQHTVVIVNPNGKQVRKFEGSDQEVLEPVDTPPF